MTQSSLINDPSEKLQPLAASTCGRAELAALCLGTEEKQTPCCCSPLPQTGRSTDSHRMKTALLWKLFKRYRLQNNLCVKIWVSMCIHQSWEDNVYHNTLGPVHCAFPYHANMVSCYPLVTTPRTTTLFLFSCRNMIPMWVLSFMTSHIV